MEKQHFLNNFKNTYLLMRHGTSIANEEGIIISNTLDGVSMFGLTDVGKKEVVKSAQSALENELLNKDVVIFSSDFLRARETAEITSKVLGVNSIIFTKKLRERFFGNFDKTNNSNYDNVWNKDVINENQTADGVESVASVLYRVTELIKYLENNYEHKKILLVSHGDTLQILQSMFTNTNPSKHRSLKSIHPAEIRAV